MIFDDLVRRELKEAYAILERKPYLRVDYKAVLDWLGNPDEPDFGHLRHFANYVDGDLTQLWGSLCGGTNSDYYLVVAESSPGEIVDFLLDWLVKYWVSDMRTSHVCMRPFAPTFDRCGNTIHVETDRWHVVGEVPAEGKVLFVSDGWRQRDYPFRAESLAVDEHWLSHRGA